MSFSHQSPSFTNKPAFFKSIYTPKVKKKGERERKNKEMTKDVLFSSIYIPIPSSVCNKHLKKRLTSSHTYKKMDCNIK